jgi:hypothetical protein
MALLKRTLSYAAALVLVAGVFASSNGAKAEINPELTPGYEVGKQVSPDQPVPRVLEANTASSATGMAYRAYHESFLGESTFPTTPEEDFISAGGMTSSTSNPSLPVVLNGTEARFTLLETGFNGPNAQIVLGGGKIADESFTMRARFNDLAVSEGAVATLIVITMIGHFGPQFVAPGLLLSNSGNPGRLSVATPLGNPNVEIPLAMTAAVVGGASFTFEGIFDRTAGTVSVALDVEGEGRFDGPTIEMGIGSTVLDSLKVDAMFTYFGPEPETQFQIDVADFSLYTEGPKPVPSAGPLTLGILVLFLMLSAPVRSL